MDELYKIGADAETPAGVLYNATACTLKSGDTVVDLTAQTNRLLRCFVLNAGQTLTKEQIIAHVWDYDADVNGSSLIYDAVSDVRRLLKKSGLPRCITTKNGIGYVFTASVERIKLEKFGAKTETAIKKAEETVHVSPAFSENAPKWTLDTVYLLLMGDSMYKKAWFLRFVGCTEKLPPLCLEPGSADNEAEDAFFSYIFPETVWARILLACPEKDDRKALYAGEAPFELLSDLKQDFQNDGGWRGRNLAKNCRDLLDRMLMPSVIETTLGAVLQNSPPLNFLYRLWQRCNEESHTNRGLALVLLCALLGEQNFRMLAETRDVIDMLNESFI